jgi:hypothetical protein
LLALYPDRLRFEGQRANLVRYAEDHAERHDVVMLLGYIELTTGAPGSAAAIFSELSPLRPDDEVVFLLRESAERLKAFQAR